MEQGSQLPPANRQIGRTGSAVWGSAFVSGLFLAILGLIALSATWATSVVTIFLLGWALIVAGVVEIVHALRYHSEGRTLISLLGGLLSAVVGFLLIYRPMAGLATLTILLAGYFLASGLFRAVTSISDRYPQWGWDFFYGVISLLLGVMVLRSWPTSSVWLVGTLVAIEILFRGVALMSGGLTMRQLMRHAHI